MGSLKLGAVVAASFALGGPVLAADMAVKAPPPPGFNWSGLYIGANVGGLFGTTSDSVVSNPPKARRCPRPTEVTARPTSSRFRWSRKI